jgi:large subunit ribosomal protein L19
MTTIALSPVEIDARKDLPFRSGDVVRVDVKVKEGKDKKTGEDKFRIQSFEGIVLARKHGSEMGATFTVRKMSGSIAVERIFPLYSPMIEKINLVRSNKSVRSKLYFIRDKATKEVRKKLKEIKKTKAAPALEGVEA